MCELTETTGCYSGSNHNRASTGLEFGEHPIALLLLLVTVNGEGGPAVLAEVLGEVVSHALGAGENDDLAVLLRDGLEVTNELALLFEFGADFDNLLDVVVSGELSGTDVDLGEVVEEVASKTLHFLGPGGREHERLTVGTDLLQDLADLGFETHVEHAVSLVHDEVGDAAEVGLASVNHVDQTTRGGNADLGTSLEITDLGTLGHTTVNGTGAESARATEAVALDLNLVGELTSGSEDQSDGAIAGLKKGLSVDVNHGGESETDSLTGTSLGDSDKVATAEGHRPSLRLNGRGLGEAHLLDFGENIVGEAGLVERGDGLGDVLTLDGHLLGGAVVLNLTFAAVGDTGVLDVEVLLERNEIDGVPVDGTEVATEVAHAVSAAIATTVASTVSAAAIAVRATAAVGASAAVSATIAVAARATTTAIVAASTGAGTVAVSTAVRHLFVVDLSVDG